MVVQARQHFGMHIFREIVIIPCWCIWLHESIIFDGDTLSLSR
ncbi:hypothetical protein HU200_018863 [Digitaria exilis]|uniref:Uncharacterized protein n=1 Tax=Digitaria exilis TaxID=1010633 RepID=A0A835F4V3_9POAL|nr:hypothetical protein HU200_018863 [Digitaria exilis]